MPSLVQIMICRLFGAKPLSQPRWFRVDWKIKEKFQFNPNQYTSFIQRYECENVSSANWRPFSLGINEYTRSPTFYVCFHNRGNPPNYQMKLLDGNVYDYINILHIWYFSNASTTQIYSYDIIAVNCWGRVTHKCISKLTIIGSYNGLSPVGRHAIIWTNAGMLLIGPLG